MSLTGSNGTDMPGSGSHSKTPPGHRIVRIFRYIFLVPGAPLTGHTDAVEHDINTCDRPPIRVDYRQLNDATTKDAYSLPRIDDTLDMLAGK